MAIPSALTSDAPPRHLTGKAEINLRKLAREIAMQILPLENILQLHQISVEELERLQGWPSFMKMLAEELEVWNSALNTKQRVEIKTWSMLEEALPSINQYIHSPDFNDSAKVALIGVMQKQVGIGVKENSSAGTSGEKISITINTGSQELKLEREISPVLEGRVLETITETPVSGSRDDAPSHKVNIVTNGSDTDKDRRHGRAP
jgi:hypothetical protein